MKRRELVAAIDVRWTPEIAARVKGRLGERIAARRRRRRQATMLVTLFAVGVGGLALAWIGRGPRPEARDTVPMARSRGQGPAAPAPARVPAPPPVMPSVGGPTMESAKPAPPHRPAHARRGVPPAPDVVADLLSAADAARLAGRPRDAVGPLTEIATGHASDPRAAIAAFQLGRVLADELHDRAGAARAFARAFELAPDGPLAPDARARAGEAAR